MSIDDRLAQLGIGLPGGFAFPKANRIGCVQAGNLLFASGHPPAGDLGSFPLGKVGRDLDEATATSLARSAALNILASVKAQLGSLDPVDRVVKVFGMVNSAPGFNRQFAVIDGASDLFIEIWGPEKGRHARSAVGMAELPRDFPIEVEAIFLLS